MESRLFASLLAVVYGAVPHGLYPNRPKGATCDNGKPGCVWYRHANNRQLMNIRQCHWQVAPHKSEDGAQRRLLMAAQAAQGSRACSSARLANASTLAQGPAWSLLVVVPE